MNRIYARYNYPEQGFAWNVEHSQNIELKIGKRYLVEAYINSMTCTDIWIPQSAFPLNAKHFDFEDIEGNSIDIREN